MGHRPGGHLTALLGTDPAFLQKAGVDLSAISGFILIDGAGPAAMQMPLRVPVARSVPSCSVLSACQYLTRADCPAAYDTLSGDDPSTVLIRGGSCIVDPLDNVLAEPSFGGEVTHVVDLDRRIIARGKYDLDVVGHYARPDIFNLTVDTRPKRPVSFVAEQDEVQPFPGKRLKQQI